MTNITNGLIMKHLSKKLIIIVIIVAVIATGTIVFFACQPKQAEPIAPKNGHTVSMTPPTDGSLPDHYSGLENLAYMAGRLSARTYYHSENTGVVNNPVGKQTVVGSKDYSDGLLITQSISMSSFVNVAQQKFFGDGKVVVRGPKYGKDKWKGIQTEWADKSPVAILDTAQYAEAYGLWASEFSDYVLNEETVLEVSELSKTSEGYYKQTFTLDPEGSTYYYKRQMRTMGNLGSYPEFSSVSITFTFDDTWSVLQADIVEAYHVSVSVIKASCNASSTIVYSYDEAKVDVSAYETYFKNYANAAATGNGERELGVVDYLQYGFAGYLEQPSTFDLGITMGGRTLSGKVTLDIANGLAIRISLGDACVNIESDSVYIIYKDFKGKIALSDLLGLFGDDVSGVDPTALMEQLGAGTIEKDGENVFMTCSLSLGSLEVPLNFRFTENSGEVSFIGVEATLSYKSIRIDASFAPSQDAEEVSVIDHDGAVDMKPYLDGILKLVADKSFTLTANYANESLGLSVTGELYANAETGSLYGEIVVGYANLSIPVEVAYVDQTIYLQVYNVKIKTTKDYITEALETALGNSGVILPDLSDINVNAVIGAVITADYDAVIKTLRLTDEALTLAVDLDALIEDVLGKDMNLGEVVAVYAAAENTFALSVYGVTATLSGTAAREVGAPADKDEYIELSIFEQYIEPIKALATTKDIAFELSVETTIRETRIAGEIVGEVKFENDTELYLKATLNGKTVEVQYANAAVYVGFAGQKIRLAESELTELSEKLAGLLEKAEGGEEISAFLGEDGIDLQGLLESVRVATEEEGDGRILSLLVDLGVLNENLSEVTATISAEGEGLRITQKGAVEVFGLSLNGFTARIYAAENEYEYDVTGAVDMKPYLEGIYKVVEEKSFTLTAKYANESLGLSIEGELYANAGIGAVEGEITVKYANVTVPVAFTYIDGTAYVQISNIKLKATNDDIRHTIELALNYTNVTLPESGTLDLAGIICAIITADLTQVVKTFTITESGIELSVDADALLGLITEKELNIGILEASYDPHNVSFVISVYGLNATVSGAATREVGAPADKDDYVGLALLEKFIDPVKEIAGSDDIAFTLGFSAAIMDIEMDVALSGEVKLVDKKLSELYLKAEIFVDGYADEVVEISYSEDYVTLVYGGMAMRVAETQLTQLAEKLGGLFASGGDLTNGGFDAVLLLFSTDGIDLQSFIESIRLTCEESDGITAIELLADLGILNDKLSLVNANLSTDGQRLSASLLQSTTLYGLEVNGLEACVWAAENEFTYDFSQIKYCENVFEFIFNSYVELADTRYLNVTADYTSELLTANVSALFEFIPADDTAMNVNFEIYAEIHTYIYNEANEKVADANHYLYMVTVEETAYVSYSLFGYNASNALYVKLPVDQLFVMGNMVMPLIMPILGIGEDVYYLDLINNLLATPHKIFSTDIFNALKFADVLKLLDGIAEENANKDADGNVNVSENLSLFTLGKNENGDTVISLTGISVGSGKTLSLGFTAQKEGSVAVDTSKSYIDISSIATLVGDVLNAYEYTDTGYELSGALTLSLLGIDLDLTVNVTLKVGVEEDGTPYANITLKTNQYNNILVVGFFGTQIVIDGNTETDITIKDGNVYMTRLRTSYWSSSIWSYGFRDYDEADYKYDYRKKTLEEFAADAMNQIFFAINLSEGAKDYIGEQIEKNSSSTTTSTYDVGDMVKSYALANNVYSLSLNVGAIANNSSLGTMDINITRSQLEGRDYYDLVKLQSSMTLVSVITMKFELSHTSCGNPVDFSIVETNINRVNANT